MRKFPYNIWNPEMETMETETRKSLQLYRLKELVAFVYENVPFYTKKLNELKIRPSDITKMEDIKTFHLQLKQTSGTIILTAFSACPSKKS